MKLSDKIKKMRESMKVKVFKDLTEDKGDMVETSHATDEDGRIVSTFVKKDGKLIESSATQDSQESGAHEKAAKKVGEKEEGLTYTSVGMAVAQSGLAYEKAKKDKEWDNNRDSEKAKLGSGKMSEKSPKTKPAQGKVDSSLSSMAKQDTKNQESSLEAPKKLAKAENARPTETSEDDPVSNLPHHHLMALNSVADEMERAAEKIHVARNVQVLHKADPTKAKTAEDVHTENLQPVQSEDKMSPAEFSKKWNEGYKPTKGMSVLSAGESNVKIKHGMEDSGGLTHAAILHFAPADLAGVGTMCSRAGFCKSPCLVSSGQGGTWDEAGGFNDPTVARLAKTQLFAHHPDAFWNLLVTDMHNHISTAKKLGAKPAVRLNGTSDIAWENIRPKILGGLNIFQAFPEVQFWDYTKRFDRLGKNKHANYHLTFSADSLHNKANVMEMEKALKAGYNVAVPFGGIDTKISPNSKTGKGGRPPGQLPRHYAINGQNYEVIDGDKSDFRFNDHTQRTGDVGQIVGLRAKGDGKTDYTDFVRWDHEMANHPQAKAATENYIKANGFSPHDQPAKKEAMKKLYQDLNIKTNLIRKMIQTPEMQAKIGARKSKFVESASKKMKAMIASHKKGKLGKAEALAKESPEDFKKRTFGDYQSKPADTRTRDQKIADALARQGRGKATVQSTGFKPAEGLKTPSFSPSEAEEKQMAAKFEQKARMRSEQMRQNKTSEPDMNTLPPAIRAKLERMDLAILKAPQSHKGILIEQRTKFLAPYAKPVAPVKGKPSLKLVKSMTSMIESLRKSDILAKDIDIKEFKKKYDFKARYGKNKPTGGMSTDDKIKEAMKTHGRGTESGLSSESPTSFRSAPEIKTKKEKAEEARQELARRGEIAQDKIVESKAKQIARDAYAKRFGPEMAQHLNNFERLASAGSRSWNDVPGHAPSVAYLGEVDGNHYFQTRSQRPYNANKFFVGQDKKIHAVPSEFGHHRAMEWDDEGKAQINPEAHEVFANLAQKAQSKSHEKAVAAHPKAAELMGKKSTPLGQPHPRDYEVYHNGDGITARFKKRGHVVHFDRVEGKDNTFTTSRFDIEHSRHPEGHHAQVFEHVVKKKMPNASFEAPTPKQKLTVVKSDQMKKNMNAGMAPDLNYNKALVSGMKSAFNTPPPAPPAPTTQTAPNTGSLAGNIGSAIGRLGKAYKNVDVGKYHQTKMSYHKREASKYPEGSKMHNYHMIEHDSHWKGWKEHMAGKRQQDLKKSDWRLLGKGFKVAGEVPETPADQLKKGFVVAGEVPETPGNQLQKAAPKGVDKAKYERCVQDVKAKQGESKVNPWAVCAASLQKSGKWSGMMKCAKSSRLEKGFVVAGEVPETPKNDLQKGFVVAGEVPETPSSDLQKADLIKNSLYKANAPTHYKMSKMTECLRKNRPAESHADIAVIGADP